MNFPVKPDRQPEVRGQTVEKPHHGSTAIFPLCVNNIMSEHAEVTGWLLERPEAQMSLLHTSTNSHLHRPMPFKFVQKHRTHCCYNICVCVCVGGFLCLHARMCKHSNVFLKRNEIKRALICGCRESRLKKAQTNAERSNSSSSQHISHCASQQQQSHATTTKAKQTIFDLFWLDL